MARGQPSTDHTHRHSADITANVEEPPIPVTHGAEFSYLTAGALRSASPEAQLEGQALVLRSDAATDQSANPYLRLTLRGADGGIIEARWWRYPYPVDRRPRAGQVCWFSGEVDIYAGNRQLRIRQGRLVRDADITAFALTTRTPVEVLQAQLQAYIDELDDGLHALVKGVLTDDVYTRFCDWPAAHHRHGAVRHGLLAHSLRVVELARQMAAAYTSGGLQHDAGVVTAAALLHDVGKTRTLPPVAGAALPDEALQFDHVTLGVLMVRLAAQQATPHIEETRLEALLHAMLAHHGLREWGAPVEPHTVEAWLVHLADLAESRLWAWSGEEQKCEAS